MDENIKPTDEIEELEKCENVETGNVPVPDNNTSDTDAPELLSVEKKNKKNHKFGMKKTIVLLVVAIVLVTTLIAGYMIFAPDSDNNDENVVVLYDYELSDVSEIKILNNVSHDDITIKSFMNGTTVEWNIEGQKYDDVNQGKVGYIAQFCKHLESKYVLEYDESKLGEYELNEPLATVNITYADGSSHTVRVGKTYGSSEGAYVTVDNDKHVYVVSVYAHNYFLFPLSTLLNLPSLSKTSLSSQTLYLIDKERNVTMLSYIPGPLSGTEAWYLIEPTISETNSDSIDALFEGIGNVALNSYYCEAAGDDLSVYGFDKPVFELQSYDDNKLLLDHFVIGGKTDESGDEYYCALLHEDDEFNTSPVYTVKADQITLLDFDAVDVSSPYLTALNIYWLRHGVFTIDGETYELTIDRVQKYDDTGKPLEATEDKEATKNTYYINGKQLDELQFKTFYSKVLFLSIEGLVPNDTPKGEKLFSYSLEVVIPVTDSKTGVSYDKEAVYEGAYYKISDTYAVFKNNESDSAVFTVRCRSIDSVKEAMQLLLEGRMPTA